MAETCCGFKMLNASSLGGFQKHACVQLGIEAEGMDQISDSTVCSSTLSR